MLHASGVKFYAGAQVSVGKLKAKEKQDWAFKDATVAMAGTPKAFEDDQKGSNIRSPKYNKTQFSFGVYGGVQFSLSDLITIYNDLGIVLGSGTASTKCDELSLTINNATKNGATGDVYKDKQPARANDTVTLKQKWMLQNRTELGFNLNSNLEPFVGVTVLLSKFEHTIGDNKTEDDDKNLKTSKTCFGFGPTVGVRYKINDNLRAKFFVEYHRFAKMHKKDLVISDETEGAMDSGADALERFKDKINKANSYSVTPSTWKVGLGIEYKF